MTGLELADSLASAVDSREGAWQFIRMFARTWLSPLTAQDGCGEDELVAAEQRLGEPLPAAVREAYALFGKRSDLTSNQDRLLSPEDVDLDYAEEALVFRVENQGAADWGVPLDQLDEPDPRVDIRLNLEDWYRESWEAWLPRFSLACVEIVLSESLSSPAHLGDSRQQVEDDAALLETRYVRLPLPEYPTSRTGAPGIRWYAGTDVLLRVDGGSHLRVRARTPAALDEVRRDLPGDWQTPGGA